MNLFMRSSISCLLFIFLQLTLDGQVKVSGSFDKDTVTIGDQATFTLSIELDQGEDVIAIPRVFLDSVYSALQTFKANPNDTSDSPQPIRADYELIDLGEWSDANDDGIFVKDEITWSESTVGRRRLLESSFVLRFWDPGQNVILLPPIVYQTIDGQREQYYEGGQAIIYVGPPAGMEDVSQDSLQAAPIKPILTEPLHVSDFFVPIAILLSLLVVGTSVFLFRRYWRNKEQDEEITTEPTIIIPAHERALTSLSELRAMQLWQKGKVKQYQSELTHIIRAYLEDRYDVPALENTTHEIVNSLQEQDLIVDDVNALKRILQVADLVKFAKATPDESIHDRFMNDAVDFVKRTKKVDANELD